jgi:hypothetical protein
VGARHERAVYCVVTARRSERPTVPPSFDVLQFAKDSEARMRGARRSEPALELDLEDWAGATPKTQSEVRLVSRPNLEAPSDEAWAQAIVGMPYVAVSADQLTSLPLGHREAFLLSRLDGASDLETVISVSAMPRDEALRLARHLFESGIIAFKA